MSMGIGVATHMNKSRFRNLYMNIQKSRVLIVTVLLKDVVDAETWKKLKEAFGMYFDMDDLSIEFLILLDSSFDDCIKATILYHIKGFGCWESACGFIACDSDDAEEKLPEMLKQVVDFEVEPEVMLREIAELSTRKILEE